MNQVEITLQDIFWTLKKHFFWIVLTVAIFVAGTFAYTEFFVTPMYETSFSMGVNSNGRDSSAGVTNSELVTEARIAETYKALITSQPVIEAIKAELNGAITAAKLKNSISADVEKNTMILNITVRDSDPQRAARIANLLSEIAPEVLGKLPVGGTLYSIETAVIPKSPVSPNLGSNLTIGFVLGLLLSCAVIVLLAVLDTTIWREEDLERAFNIPVLGSIPSMKANSMVKIKKKHFRR